jgi:hypothetical protein
MKTKKIALATPTTTMVNYQFAQSLAANVGNLSSKGYSVDALFNSGSVLHRQRNNLISMFLTNEKFKDHTHLVWVDSDMIFPSNAVDTLVNHDADIVGVNYCARQGTPRFTASKNGVRFLTTADSTGLETVDILGFGLMCVKRSTLETMGYPWCDFLTIGDAVMGEDEYFCSKATNLGFKIYCDQDLSKQVFHIGQTMLDYNFPNMYEEHQKLNKV